MKHSGMKFEALILIVVTLCGTSLLAGRAYSQSSGGPLPSAAVGASGTMVPTVIFANGFVWASVQNGQSASVVQISPETRSPTAVTLSLGLVDPIQMAYDTSNDNIWITDYSVSEISVVNVSATDAPQLVATISNPTVPYTWTIPPYKNVELASTPEGIFFNSSTGTIWVANDANPYKLASGVYVYDTSAPTSTSIPIDELCLAPSSPLNPDGFAFDGTNMWVSFSESNFVQLITTSGCTVGDPVPTGIFPLSMVFDGANMWVGNGAVEGGGSLTKIPIAVPLSGGPTTTISWSAPPGVSTSGVRGLLYEGGSIWACNGQTNTVTRVRASDGVILGTYPTGAGPRGIVYDGTNIWVANSGANTLTYFNPAMVIPSSFLPSRILGLLN
jgi:hypothetical protein